MQISASFQRLSLISLPLCIDGKLHTEIRHRSCEVLATEQWETSVAGKIADQAFDRPIDYT